MTEDNNVTKKAKTDEDSKQDLPKLYSYWRSSCSWRVRIALYYKQIAFDYVAVHLVKGEQTTSTFQNINPMKEVPALLIDGHLLTQSRAIIDYLEETRPQFPLLPRAFHLRAKAREIAEIISSDTQPVQNLRVLNKYQKDMGCDDEKKGEWARHWITNSLQALESILQSSSGKYCVGDEVTIADVCLVPQLYNARRFKVDLSLFPKIVEVEKNLSLLPAFQAADPTKQPDAQL